MSLNGLDRDWADLREGSEALFGSRLRLKVVILVSHADPDELYAARIAEAGKLDRKETGREVSRLMKAGLLEPIGTRKGNARGRPAQLLERRDEASWEALVRLAQCFRDETSDGRGR